MLGVSHEWSICCRHHPHLLDTECFQKRTRKMKSLQENLWRERLYPAQRWDRTQSAFGALKTKGKIQLQFYLINH